MTDIRDQLKSVCAFVQAGDKIGTGYLVAPDLVAVADVMRKRIMRVPGLAHL